MASPDEYTAADESALVIRIHIPCVNCGYDLHGIRPSHECPECGTSAEESLATVLDPSRSRIPPLRNPKRVGIALVGMISAMLLGTLWMWVPLVLSAGDHLLRTGGSYVHYWPRNAPLVSAILALFTVASTWMLRRPTGSAGPPAYRRGLRYARLGLVFYAVCIALLSVYDRASMNVGLDHFGIAPADIDRHRCSFRLALDVTVLFALIGFRPVFRFISVRSLDHRLGRVGRQGTRAMIFAALVATVGDILRLAVGWSLRFGLGFGTIGSGVAVLGVVLIAIGEAMLTLALLNATFDAIRLARGIARPSYLREDIIG